MAVKGRIIRYLGGGGLEFLLLAIFFFTSGGKQAFFWRSTSDNFFFMFRPRNFLSYAFPIMYVTIWCSFWSTYFSSVISFDNKLFLSVHIFNKLFFLTFVATNYFFQFYSSPPLPPDIKWCVPNSHRMIGSLKTRRKKCGNY